MIQHREYGFLWELDPDPKKGQLGLLRENHYRPLFAGMQQTKSFRPKDVWLDIGANIGAFAIRAAPLVKEVIAVEPDPECFAQLKRNAEINGLLDTAQFLGSVYPLKAAVIAGEARWVDLAISNSFSSTHRLGRIRGRKSITVAGINIDETVEMYQINKIKMDCEGTEAELLETMNFGPIEEIVFEYHFSLLKDYDWRRFTAIMKRLVDASFTVLKEPGQRSKTWHTIVWARRSHERLG
jgi:methyltransferase, FkbM family